MQEVEAGTIVTATFFATNITEEKRTFSVKVELPPGWETLPFEEPFITLEPKESSLQWLVFRVPPNALAGSYPITYILQEREDPSLISQTTFSVEVLPKSSITSVLDKKIARTFPGSLSSKF